MTYPEIIPSLVSVMMPAYNAERYIGQAIESVLCQTYQNWELIVVDDGSTDATADVVSRYQDSRIRLLRQANGGEASARNTALRHMRGEFVAFLDADDAYLPEHLEATTSYLLAHPEHDGVYTDGYHIDQDGNLLKSLSSRRRGPFEGWLFEQLVRASDVFGPPICLLLRRAPILERQLTYDTRIVIGPDWDFNTRFAQHASFGYLPRMTCLYRVHLSNISIVTQAQKRTASLALCREKAIQLEGFSRCSLETRRYVFYELLVELLRNQPERQEEVTHWHQFKQLPPADQARLYRLMASHAQPDLHRSVTVRRWLRQARRLMPSDWRSTLLYSLHWISPRLYSWLLSLRSSRDETKVQTSPLSDVFEGL